MSDIDFLGLEQITYFHLLPFNLLKCNITSSFFLNKRLFYKYHLLLLGLKLLMNQYSIYETILKNILVFKLCIL